MPLNNFKSHIHEVLELERKLSKKVII